jgi:AcrR family transcriptional regulator
MNPTNLPTTEQARCARDRVLAQAVAAGRQPSVLAVARELGLSNTTFRRHFPDIASEIGTARRTPADTTGVDGLSPHDKLIARNAKLRRDNRQLRDHLAIAVANIQRLALTNHRLHATLEAASGVARLDSRRSPR